MRKAKETSVSSDLKLINELHRLSIGTSYQIQELLECNIRTIIKRIERRGWTVCRSCDIYGTYIAFRFNLKKTS